MAKKKKTVSETSIPEGVYPELDNDLARDNVENHIPAADLSELYLAGLGMQYPLGVYPVFDEDLPRDNMENNITAANPEGAWPDPGLE